MATRPRITPARLTVYSEVSQEALEDNPVVRDAISRRAVTLECAAGQRHLRGPGREPQGMLDRARPQQRRHRRRPRVLPRCLRVLAHGQRGRPGVVVCASLKIGGTARYTTSVRGERGGSSPARCCVSRVHDRRRRRRRRRTATVYGYDPSLVWVGVRRRDFAWSSNSVIARPSRGSSASSSRVASAWRCPQSTAFQVFSIVTP